MSKPIPRFTAILVSVLVGAVAGWQLHPYLTWPAEQLARHSLLIDDAFFYTTIVENFSRYGLLSLDGEMTSNGFQPLWMLLLISLKVIFAKTDALQISLGASWICYVAFSGLTTYYLVRRLTAGTIVSALLLAASILLQSSFQRFVVKGLEVPLLLFLLALLLPALDRAAARLKEDRFSRADSILLALLATAIFLARTDMFWVAAVVGFWLLYRSRRANSRWLSYGITVTAFVLPYLIFNRLTQGGIMPISGRVKLFYLEMFYPTWPAYFRSEEWRGLFAAFEYVFGLTLLPFKPTLSYTLTGLFIVAGLGAIWKLRKSATLSPGVRLLTLIIVLHLLYMHLVHRELRPYTGYYFAPEIVWLTLVASLLVGSLADPLFRRGQSHFAPGSMATRGTLVTAALLGAFTICAGSWLSRNLRPIPLWTGRMDLAADAKALLPEGERLAAFWPGVFAQFSGHSTVPLDGIIGSRDYFETYVKTGREFEYLKERNIRYVAIALREEDFARIAPPKDSAVTPPRVGQWANLGTLRVFESRDALRRIVALRPAGDGLGWYLMEFDWNKWKF